MEAVSRVTSAAQKRMETSTELGGSAYLSALIISPTSVGPNHAIFIIDKFGCKNPVLYMLRIILVLKWFCYYYCASDLLQWSHFLESGIVCLLLPLIPPQFLAHFSLVR